jgi:uncharacterized membrane protein YtjA (UPF0391 family)
VTPSRGLRGYRCSHRTTPCVDETRRSTVSPMAKAFGLLLIAIVAGVLGFVVLAGVIGALLQIAFFLFLVLFVVALVRRGRRPRQPAT